MSGPITTPTGSADGIDWLVEDGSDPSVGGGLMVHPAAAHFSPVGVPSYYAGPLPYFGDFQMTPSGTSALRLVIQFSKPIKYFRTTAMFVGGSGLMMSAVRDVSHFTGTGGATYTASASVIWNASESGTKTLHDEAGFRFVVIQTVAINPATDGKLGFGPTFKNTYFFEVLPTPEVIRPPEPDVTLPRGAGRSLSYYWPPSTYLAANSPMPRGIVIRPTPVPTTLGAMNEAISGAPPGPEGRVNYRGAEAGALNGTSTASHQYGPQATTGPFMIYPVIERSTKANLDGLDEYGYWRLWALLAFQSPGAHVPRDFGLTVGVGGATQIRGGAQQAGIAFGCTNDGEISVASRKVGGTAFDYDAPLVLPTDFDVADWHEYEMRFLPATATSEGAIKFMIDGDVKLTLLWGPGTVLPPITAGGQMGLYWSVGNSGGIVGTTTRLYIAMNGGIQVAAAMSEDALL